MVGGGVVVAGEYAYDYRLLCVCGTELETDDRAAYDKFAKAHGACKSPDNEALTLLTRLVTAVESIVDHSHGR